MLSDEVVENAISRPNAGDFGRIAEYTREGGTEFVRRLKLEPGSRVLDVGCGPGFQAIEAAKAGAEVAAIDLDPGLLEQARASAVREGLGGVAFYRGDAQGLPFADATFDAVVSVFGAMFAPRPDRVASEMHRVCRPGGLIAMANWTPDGMVGQMFRIARRYARSAGWWPFEWGRASWTRMCFGGAVENVEFSRHAVTMTFPFPVPAVVDFWMTYCRSLGDIFVRLGPERQTDFRLDLEWLWSGHNISAEDGITVVEAEYLEVHAIRRRKNAPVERQSELLFDERAYCTDPFLRHPTFMNVG